MSAPKIVKAVKDKRGIVINPNQAKNLVVHEIPAVQGAAASGKIL